MIHRLFRRYVIVSAWVALLMWALWQLGVESIYYHVTPLYALYMPIYARWWIPVVILAVFGGGVALWRRKCRPNCPISPLAIVALAGISAALAYAAHRNGATPRALPGLLAGQGFAAAVFAAGFAALAYALRRWNWPDGEPDARQTRWLLVGLVLFAFLFPAAIAMMRGGVTGIAQAYMRYDTEYVNDIGAGGSIRGLFRDYLRLHPYLTLHSKAHPPGPIAILWLWSFVVGRTALGLSIATMAMAAAAVVPFFHWVSDMLGKKAAVTTSVLFVVMPSIVMFSATSADIFFMTFGVTTLFLFWRALHRNSLRYQLAAGVMYAVCSLTSFTLISLGAFFAFTGLLRLRERRAAVIQTAVVMVIALVGVHVLVRVWSGFDVIAVFQACLAQFQHDQLSLDLQEPRYASWVYRILNPFTFFIYAGIPVSILFIQRFLERDRGTMSIMWVVLATAFVLNLLYMGRGEGERSALYIFPFLAIPAGSYLVTLQERLRSADALLVTVACLAFQCWLMESVFYTYW